MSLIKNLVKEPVKDPAKDGETEAPKVRNFIKTATDLQRLKLEKLMRDPSKPVVIPEVPKEKDYMASVPTFVRNVMGSSAGAGSGEFHVYRHLRRKEYARQKTIQAKSMQEQLDEKYQQKLDDNRRLAEEKTAKKRAKRLKKKERAKRARKNGKSSGAGAQKEGNKGDTSGEETQSDVSDKDEEEETKAIDQVTEEEKDAAQIDASQTTVPEVVQENSIEQENKGKNIETKTLDLLQTTAVVSDNVGEEQTISATNEPQENTAEDPSSTSSSLREQPIGVSSQDKLEP